MQKLLLINFLLCCSFAFAQTTPDAAKTPAAKPASKKPVQVKTLEPKAPAQRDDAELSIMNDDDLVVETDPEPVPVLRKDSEKFNPDTFTMEPKKVKHPLAEKGLMKITKDKTYYFKVKQTPDNEAATVRLGMMPLNELSNPETGTSFSDLYSDSTNPVLMADYEWLLWKSFGRASIVVGSGILFANGHGEFRNEKNKALEPKESFTLFGFPNNLGFSWKAQFWDRQLFVPHAVGGGMAWALMEMRDDDKSPHFGLAPAAYGAAGLGLNLRSFDTQALLDMDREYGINEVFFIVEYRLIVGLSKKLDFSSNFINAGFTMEF